MFEIILIPHGPLSKAMLETAQMIVGEQEHVTCFGLYLGDSVDLFRERVEEEIRNKLEESDVLLSTKETMVDVNQLLYALDTAF